LAEHLRTARSAATVGMHFAQWDESSLRGGTQGVSDRKRRLDMGFVAVGNG